MGSAVLFLVVALRALIELLFWVWVGRTVLWLLAGRRADQNTILNLFDLILRPPRALVARIWPRGGAGARESLLLALLVVVWLALAMCKAWLDGQMPG